MQTIRRQIIDLLRQQEFNAREISQALSIMEKEVYGHLEHIDRTIGRHAMKMVVLPYTCLSCGYSFVGRRRWTRPSRCPVCRRGHIRMAAYRIEAL
ncbi:MAG TPA: transcriptional regulator [Desulfobulbaceae bacterium]|nr:transcriptional regulator [Desulfobulbaceae bacterium]